MAHATIGGRSYAVSLPNFVKLKAAWKYLAVVQKTDDPMGSVEALLGVVSVGSAEPVTVEALEEALAPAEMAGLRSFINELMVEIGLAAKPGEPVPLEAAAAESP